MEPQKIRSLFISDVHLGDGFSRPAELREFLKQYQPETLYLVGDFIDGWKLKRRFYWIDDYTFIIRKIISLIKHGTKVVYITGNHDEFLRDFTPQILGHIEVVDEIIHTTVDGKQYLVIHGDCFDHITKHWKWTSYLGDRAYTFALWVNKLLNACRRKLGLKYWSFSAMCKAQVKEAVAFINNFEHFVVKYTKQKECEGVICGHIHTPIIKDIDGIKYLNCGDWVESCTALVEHYDGRIELVNGTNSSTNK